MAFGVRYVHIFNLSHVIQHHLIAFQFTPNSTVHMTRTLSVWYLLIMQTENSQLKVVCIYASHDIMLSNEDAIAFQLGQT